MTDDNMPAEIWATPGEGDPISGDGRSGMWSEFQPITNTTPYVRKVRWRTVGEDGMPDVGRRCLVKNYDDIMSVWDPTSWMLPDGVTVKKLDTDRWIYLNEVLEILG